MPCEASRDFRRQIGEASDEEIWRLMLESDEDASTRPMSLIEKQQIKGRLRRAIWRQRINTCLKYAAVVALLIGCAAGLYVTMPRQAENLIVSTIVRSGSKSEMTLPDGTVVYINGDSRLSYDMSDSKVRSVTLTGEAYFDVAKNPERPFQVHAGDIQVEALGTSFNIRMRKDGQIETSLLSGKVLVTADGVATDVILLPGEKAIYAAADKSFAKTQADRHVEIGWIDDYLVFDAEPLYSVIEKIERTYGVSVELLSRKQADDLLSGSFYREDLTDVMQTLSMQYGFRYEIKKDSITIY